MEAHSKLQSVYDNVHGEKVRLEARMQKMKDLYELGDMSKEEYLRKREAIQKELRWLTPPEEEAKNLDKLAEFLVNVAEAWEAADQEHRNKLARCLFEEVWVKDKQVVA